MSSFSRIQYKSTSESFGNASILITISYKGHERNVDAVLGESIGRAGQAEGLNLDEFTYTEICFEVDKMFDHHFPVCDL